MPRQGSTSSRGYGAAHQRLRRVLDQRVRLGLVDCWRCGRRIQPGEDWHLGHDDHDRSQYRGAECVGCNTRAGSDKAHGRSPRPRSVTRW